MFWKTLIKNIMYKFFWKYVVPRLKFWGVEFECNLPPEFIITEHARQRMMERMNCSDIKIKKITIKAWQSKERVSQEYLNKREYYVGFKAEKGRYVYRMFMGYFFVFVVLWNKKLQNKQKRLITVIK